MYIYDGYTQPQVIIYRLLNSSVEFNVKQF